MVGCITDSMDMSFSKLWKMVKHREVCCTAVLGVTRSQYIWATEQQKWSCWTSSISPICLFCVKVSITNPNYTFMSLIINQCTICLCYIGQHYNVAGISLAVQWLALCNFTDNVLDTISDEGELRFCKFTLCSQNKKVPQCHQGMRLLNFPTVAVKHI